MNAPFIVGVTLAAFVFFSIHFYQFMLKLIEIAHLLRDIKCVLDKLRDIKCILDKVVK